MNCFIKLSVKNSKLNGYKIQILYEHTLSDDDLINLFMERLCNYVKNVKNFNNMVSIYKICYNDFILNFGDNGFHYKKLYVKQFINSKNNKIIKIKSRVDKKNELMLKPIKNNENSKLLLKLLSNMECGLKNLKENINILNKN
jgi:hypothetical protein